MTPPPMPDEIDLFRLPVYEQSWPLPRTVKSANGNLVYTFSEATCRGDEGMLSRFVELAEASDDAIETYAVEFGVLGLCRHGIPFLWNHDDGLRCSEALREDDERARAVFAKGRTPTPAAAYREPLAAWRRLAKAFGSALSLADRIRAGRPSDPVHYEQLAVLLAGGGYTRVVDMPGADALSKARVNRAQMEWDRWCLADALNALLDRAVRAQLAYDERAGTHRPTMRFAGRSLLDALTLQLAMAVCRADDSATCDGCGKVFVPSNRYRPRAGQRRFCSDCRTSGVPQKLATRDRRARSRQEDQS